LVHTTPANGWQQSVEESGAPRRVEVELVSGEEELRTRARCDGGVVEGEQSRNDRPAAD